MYGRSKTFPFISRVLLEDRERQAAVAASDVHDRPDAREVVGLEHRGRGEPGDVPHREAELLALGRILSVVLEGRHAEDRLGPRQPRLHRVDETLPGLPVHVIGLRDEHVLQAARHVRCAAGRRPPCSRTARPACRSKTPRLASPRSSRYVAPGVRARLRRHLVGRLRAVGQDVRNPELRGRRDRLHRPGRREELNQDLIRRNSALSAFVST